MKVVILAGGLGTRLSEETDRIPKPMVEIGGRPILWHIMKIYNQHQLQDFVICLGYKGYRIKEFFANYLMHQSDVTIDLKNGSTEVHQSAIEPWRVSLIETGLHTMTGGRLRRVRPYLGDQTFCMTYGDGVGDVDITELLRFHRSHGRLATVTTVQPPGRFGVLKVSAGQVTHFGEKISSPDSLINAGFFVLEPQVLDYIDGDPSVWEKDVMPRLAEEGQLMAFPHAGFWQPMDTLREKQLLESLWEKGEAPWKRW